MRGDRPVVCELWRMNIGSDGSGVGVYVGVCGGCGGCGGGDIEDLHETSGQRRVYCSMKYPDVAQPVDGGSVGGHGCNTAHV